MPLAPGTRLGPYEIVAPAGAGGMGEVYRARDTRLDRTVAIKVLPEHLSAPQARQRFEREARAISALSHPHICTLHDVGSHEGADYLVMEYLDGESLADRLRRGAMPTESLLRCATEIADALDRAHRSGIVHRDLKPGNVMLTKAGSKLLDFGLARCALPLTASGQLTHSPTLTRPLTAEGSIVGTFQYMAPEQLEGKEADARSDIFSFGAVVYEMATRRRAFEASSQASLIAAILKEEPAPIDRFAPLVPPVLQRLVTQCLAKDPDERWQSAGDLKRQLQWIAAAGSSASGVQARPAVQTGARRRLGWLAWLAVGAVAAALVLLGWLLRAPEPARLVHGAIPLPQGTELDLENESMAISPDGRTLALAAAAPNGRRQIWVRSLDGALVQPLAGTEDAIYPFWSPDSRAIGFFAEGKLRRVPASGGTVQTLCDGPDGRGASWGADGVIVFVPAPFGGLHQVAASGGTPTQITHPEKEGMTHRLPHFLPDGRRLLFLAGSGTVDSGNSIMGLDLGSKQTVTVARENSAGHYVAPGYLAFVRENNLMVQPIDEESLQVTGEAVPIAEKISFNPARWAGAFAFSDTGLLVFQRGEAAPKSRLTWFGLDGTRLGTVGEPASFFDIAISPDGLRAAATIRGEGSALDIWTVDLSRGPASRFTFGAGSHSPLWSPDGRHVVYTDDATGSILIKAADGGSEARSLLAGPVANRAADSWHPDGSRVACRIQSGTAYDEWIVPVAQGQAPQPFVATPASELNGRFSPDGRWVSYVSNESGRMELYVVPYPGPGGKWQISSGSAVDGFWLGDGRALAYQTPEFKLMAVEVTALGNNLEIGARSPLFGGAALRYPFAIARDGRRLLAAVPIDGERTPELTLMVNWKEALRSP